MILNVLFSDCQLITCCHKKTTKQTYSALVSHCIWEYEFESQGINVMEKIISSSCFVCPETSLESHSYED